MKLFVHWTLCKIHLYVAHAQHFFYYTWETVFVNTFPAGTFCLVSHVFTISFGSMHIFTLCFICFFYFFFYSVLFFCHFSFFDPNFFMTKYAVFFFHVFPRKKSRNGFYSPFRDFSFLYKYASPAVIHTGQFLWCYAVFVAYMKYFIPNIVA